MNKIDNALGKLNNLLGVIINVPVLATAIWSALAYYFTRAIPYFIVCLSAIIGVLLLIIWRNRQNEKWSSPMGYQVEDVVHEFRMDESDPRVYHRTYTRSVVARRSKVYLVDGLTRSNATVDLDPLKSKPDNMFSYRGVDNTIHYIAAFSQEIPRGSQKEVSIHEKFTFENGGDPQYFHTMAYWAKRIKITVQIPPRFVVDGSMSFCSVRRYDQGNREQRRPLKKISPDPHTGLAVVEINDPKPGFRYGIVWEWSDIYHEDMVKLKGKEADMGVDNE